MSTGDWKYEEPHTIKEDTDDVEGIGKPCTLVFQTQRGSKSPDRKCLHTIAYEPGEDKGEKKDDGVDKTVDEGVGGKSTGSDDKIDIEEAVRMRCGESNDEGG